MMQYQTRFSKRAKRITIKVEFPDLVVVSAPKRTSRKIIDKFVKQQQSWIRQQLKTLKHKRQHIETEKHILIFGEKFLKDKQFNSDLPLGVHIHNEQLLLNFPPKMDDKTIDKEMEIFLKKAGRTYIKSRVKQLAVKMGLEYNKLTLRNQKTRWGSCSSKNNLSLNWRLVHYDPLLIDYVIIHELAHLKQHNHSQNFWKLVAEFDPLYKQHRRELKKQGVTFA